MNNNDKQGLIVRKSNDLINSKYMSTLLENQIISVAMTRIEVDGNDEVTASIYPGELMKLTGRGNNLYTELKIASKSIIGHGVVIEDGKGNFKAFPIVKYAEYVDGVFKIKFNEEIKPHIIGLKSNYTTMNLITLTNFKKNATFRMYELLRKEIYKSDPKVDGGAVEIVYNISELKFMLSLANLDEAGVQREIAKSKGNIDWDHLYNDVVIEKSYTEWRDLRRNIILPAQKELAETSDIRFEFKGIRQGGNTYKNILFRIYPNEVSEDVHKDITEKALIIESSSGNSGMVESAHQYGMREVNHIQLYEKYRGHNGLTTEDIDLMIDKAEGDDEKVSNAIEMADKQEEINNYIGWILKCIENGYEEVPVMQGSHELATAIIDTRKQIHAPEFKLQMWEKTTKKDDFEEFLAHIGMDLEKLEVIYDDVDDRINMYFDWKKKLI